MQEKIQLIRGEVFYFVDSPFTHADSWRYFADGALAIADGKVIEAGEWSAVSSNYPGVSLHDFSGKLIMPGLIDPHIHYPQTEMIGMYGRQLIDWLNDYTYPTEHEFSSLSHSVRVARQFLQTLFRNGTTSCIAYATIFPDSVDALFAAASLYNMGMMTGRTLMNHNAPDYLLDTTAQGEKETLQLIERWHGKGRNRYVVTPRFALTSTADQLEMAGKIHQAYPDTYIQTHLSESEREVATALDLFPDCMDYLEIYEQAGLSTDRTVYGHCVHLSDSEWQRIAETGAVIAHCPTSNFFLGSGIYSLKKANSFRVKTTLATDVGGGTSFSLWKTMGEAYKGQQLKDYSVSPFELLYMCTLGTARALHAEQEMGSFQSGMQADFIVVDYVSNSLLEARWENLIRCNKDSLENKLFGLQILGDESSIKATFINGQPVFLPSQD